MERSDDTVLGPSGDDSQRSVARAPDSVTSVLDAIDRNQSERAMQLCDTASPRYRAGAREAERDVADGCFELSERSPRRPYLLIRRDGSYAVDIDDHTEGRTVEWWAGYTARLSELRPRSGPSSSSDPG